MHSFRSDFTRKIVTAFAAIRLSVWHCAEARFSNESTFSYAHKKAAATCLATAFRNCLAYDIPNDSSVG